MQTNSVQPVHELAFELVIKGVLIENCCELALAAEPTLSFCLRNCCLCRWRKQRRS
jgi:hypothetical protein